MIFNERSLTMREFMTNESVPLSLIQEAILEYLRDRTDVLVFGAQAVNAYVDDPRMSQDVDIMSLNAKEFTEELRQYLNVKFNIAVRTREVSNGRGYRIYQVRKPTNRHLIDVRSVEKLPPWQRIEGILVPTPEVLICQKVISMVSRPKTAKGMTDIADLRRMLLTFSQLKIEQGPVLQALESSRASDMAIAAWKQLVMDDIEIEDDDAY